MATSCRYFFSVVQPILANKAAMKRASLPEQGYKARFSNFVFLIFLVIFKSLQAALGRSPSSEHG